MHIGKSLSGVPIRRTKKVHGNQVLSSLDREKVAVKVKRMIRKEHCLSPNVIKLVI